MALKRLTVHLEPNIDDWIRQRAERSGNSINQEINNMLAILKRGFDQKQKQAEINAMKAKIEAIRNQKAALEGAAHLTQAPLATKQVGKEKRDEYYNTHTASAN